MVTQGDKAVGFAPAFRLVPEFALLVGIGFERWFPVGRLQLLHKSRGLARNHDKFCFGFLVGLDGVPAIEPEIGSRVDVPDATGQGRKYLRQMTGNLLSVGPVAVAQLPRDVLAGLGYEGENRLIAFLSFVLRVVPYPPTNGRRARKGIFLTTSSFTKDAHEYAEGLETKVILIGGAQLAELMFDYGVGVKTESTYVVKRIDSDFFEDGRRPERRRNLPNRCRARN